MGENLQVSPEGLAAWSSSAHGVANDIATAGHTVGTGPSVAEMAPVFGTVGAGFIEALDGLVREHVGAIASLASDVRDTASAGADSADAYVEQDDGHARSIAEAGERA